MLFRSHPAKFPEAVKNACGVTPKLPEWLSDLMDRQERFEVLANDEKVVKDYIALKSRISR